MSLLFALGVMLCFRQVLPTDVIFLAPDAPIEPFSFSEAWHNLFVGPLTLQKFLFLLPYSLAYEGTFWVDAYIMCLAGVLLLRSRGMSPGAAWVGGFCAGFMGYFFTLFCAGHRGVVDALAVTALAFGAVSQLFATRRRWWGILGSGCLALGLAAQADVWFLMVLLLGAYTLYLLIEARDALKVHGQSLALMGVAFLIFALPALEHTFGVAAETRAVQLQQAADASPATQSPEEAHFTFITDWSLPPEDLLELAVPGIHGHTSYPMDPKPYNGRMGSAEVTLRQHTIHPGWLTLLLAGWSWLYLRRRDGQSSPKLRHEVLFWWCVVGVTTLLALGRYTPLYTVVAHLPVLDQIRAPVKWFHLTGFALALLAGMGADRLVKRFGVKAAFLGCTLIALNGALVARAYVFPIDVSLAAAPLVKALPWDAALYHGPGAPRMDNPARWHGRRVVHPPTDANVALLNISQVQAVAPTVQPFARQYAYGTWWGLYRFPILTPSK